MVQGNLDPAMVLAGIETALAGTDAVLADNRGRGRIPATSSTSVTACNPTPIQAYYAAVVDHVKDRTTA